MTTLATDIRRLIAANGPIPVADYMALCLGHPQHGYYMHRDPFGAAGDFTTAPEISQVFGELIGLWAAAVWSQMGAPTPVRLVELGPGRGTMMADVLRAARVLPAFRTAMTVHLVETSPVLRQRQEQSLDGAGLPICWHRAPEEIAAGPAIVLANEFFDALPVEQAVKTTSGWRRRLVGIDQYGRLAFMADPAALPDADAIVPAALATAAPGAIYEWRSDAPIRTLAARLARQGGAALIIDYGHRDDGIGETLQAVRAHGFADPLAEPGEVDLTAHVDFGRLARAAEAAGATTAGPVTQATFLRRLGIAARTARLGAANPDRAGAIGAAAARLVDPAETGMGRLFKVLGVCHPSVTPLPGLDRDDEL